MTNSRRRGPLGAPRPRIEVRPPRANSAAPEAVALAKSAGLELDEWQQNALDIALGEGADGRWSAFEFGILCPRQNGKGSVLEARELAGLFLFGEQLILHSAHEFKTAQEAFRRVLRLVEQTPHLRKQVARVRTSHGEEGIELRSGARLRFVARSTGSGRGFTADCVILDEAYKLDAEAMAALIPTMSAVPNPQVWYASSAPMATSSQLHLVRRRALSDAPGRLAFAEWSRDPALARDDPEAWRQANPSLGIRISEEFIRGEMDALPAAVFDRERLGDPDLEAGAEQVWTAGRWEACLSSEAVPVAPFFVGVDAAPDRSSAAIVFAGGGVVELALDRQRRRLPVEFGALAGDVVRVAGELGAPVVIDPAGPANFILPDLERAGVEVRKVSGQQMGQACGAFWNAVDGGSIRVRHHHELNEAVRGAKTLPKGDVWVWARKNAAVDVSPLVAATLAWWGSLGSEPPPSDHFAIVL